MLQVNIDAQCENLDEFLSTLQEIVAHYKQADDSNMPQDFYGNQKNGGYSCIMSGEVDHEYPEGHRSDDGEYERSR